MGTAEARSIARSITKAITPNTVWEQLQHQRGGSWQTIQAANPPATEQAQQQWINRVRRRRYQLEHYQFEHYQFEHCSPTTAKTPIKTSATSSQPTEPHHPTLLLAEPNPTHFLADFLAALLAGWHMALANPRWGTREWASAHALIQPDLIWGQDQQVSAGMQATSQTDRLQTSKLPSNQQTSSKPPSSQRLFSKKQRDAAPPPSRIFIPTGGTSGNLKFIPHTWASLMASVQGFRQHFIPEGRGVNVYCVLPLYHVSGLMQVLRAWASGGKVAIAPFKQLETESPLVTDPTDWFISLVPTQLERLLQAGKGEWLSGFKTVLLGGAPPWPTLLARSRSLGIPLSLSYGMTETAAMVTALQPQDFLQGHISSGQVLPHAKIQILNNNQPCPTGTIGQIVIDAKSLAEEGTPLYTDDLGYFTDGHLHITGRLSRKIISGGENIFPAEIEAVLRGTGQVKDICVLGLPDATWGEAVTAVYVPSQPTVSPDSLRAAIAPHLSHYKRPKNWIALSKLPRNAQGKLNLQQLMAQIALATAPNHP